SYEVTIAIMGSRSIVDVSASSTRKLSAPCLSGSTGEAGNDHGLGKGTRSWSMNGYHYYDLESTTLFFQRNRVKRNRMRESCSYGSVRERGGNEPLYSEVRENFTMSILYFGRFWQKM